MVRSKAALIQALPKLSTLSSTGESQRGSHITQRGLRQKSWVQRPIDETGRNQVKGIR
ncbi:Hypothetical predicted protein [Prunus dulcis]|uniref:Uncharacterized protein n=1 Tax=Prunus dulcis TaxID=3755 RepID=A0A5E4FY12_PRUDU|nr:Hypothetical predicted protein [Prunus dulcis]